MKEALINKYLNGETSLQEEQELLRILQTVPSHNRTSEECALLLMLSYTKVPQEEDIFTAENEEEYDRIVRSRKRRTTWKYVGIAAAVALVAIVSIVGLTHNETPTKNLAVAYVYGEKMTDEDVVMAMMHNTMSEMLASSTADEKLRELFNPK